MKKALGIILATLWISISEFVRNEFLLKDYWHEHYQMLGMDFPDSPINGAVWGFWSLLFAIFLYLLSRRFNFWGTSLVGWFAAFLMMWVATANLGVLPFGVLFAAIPLSLVESIVATWIISRFD